MTKTNSIYAPTPLSVSNGGTGNSTQLSNGQVWIGNSGVSPSRSTLTAGTGISVTNGVGSITIKAALEWIITDLPIINMVANKGYVLATGPNPRLIIPTTPTPLKGDTFSIMSLTVTNGYTVELQEDAGQFYYNDAFGGILSTATNYASITIVCSEGTVGAPAYNVLSTNGATFTFIPPP